MSKRLQPRFRHLRELQSQRLKDVGKPDQSLINALTSGGSEV